MGRFRQVRLSQAPVWWPSGAWGTREAVGDTVVGENLIGCRGTRKGVAARTIGRVSTIFGEDGWLDRGRAKGVLNPRARESKARTGRFLERKLISGFGQISSYESQPGAANGKDSWGAFQENLKC